MSVMIWVVQLETVAQAAIARHLELLDEDEMVRLSRFRYPEDREAFAVAHLLVRASLARFTGALPASFRFAPGRHGKPVALLNGKEAPVSFNLSHTRWMVGVAVCGEPGRGIGFDIEQKAEASMGVAEACFDPEETAQLRKMEEPERRLHFMKIWTKKEALLKATGEGLSERNLRAAGKGNPAAFFEQRVFGSDAVATLCVLGPTARDPNTVWRQADFDDAISGQLYGRVGT